MTRRRFMELAGVPILLGVGGDVGQISQTELDRLDAYGLIVHSDRPSVERIRRTWDTFRFVHLDPHHGGRYEVTHLDEGWRELALKLPDHKATDLPADAINGQIALDLSRGTLAWRDRDHWEWPTFVDNRDIETGTTTVSNTTAETEVTRFTFNDGALVLGRTFVTRVFGNYGTAAAEDDFQYRVYLGDMGFDPTAGEGALITDVSTVQENVDPGSPWQMKTTLSVWEDGTTGSIASHSEGAFNDTKRDDHVDPVTVDTTTAEEIVSTITWNNAKAENTATRGIGYPQQMG